MSVNFCECYQSLFDYHSSVVRQSQPSVSLEFTSVKLDWDKLRNQNERKSNMPVNESRRGRKRHH